MTNVAAKTDDAQAVGRSLAERVVETSAPSLAEAMSGATLVKIAVLAVLFCWLNFWQFKLLQNKWLIDPNWSHGFLIPLFSLYLLYSRRADLFRAKRRTCLWGLPLLLLGLVQTLAGSNFLQNHYVSHLGLILLLFGMVLYLGGPGVIRVVWLPILFLAFAMPIPDYVYSKIALPLQNMAAASSRLALSPFVEITAKQSSLMLVSVSGTERPLQVAEACAGMRLLVAFMALGVAMAYLEDRPIWQRVVLVAMGVPIAILCNVVRVIITCLMNYWDRPELGKDFMHSFTGMLMLVPALLMLGGLSWLLRRLFVEEERDEDRQPQEAQP